MDLGLLNFGWVWDQIQIHYFYLTQTKDLDLDPLKSKFKSKYKGSKQTIKVVDSSIEELESGFKFLASKWMFKANF